LIKNDFTLRLEQALRHWEDQMLLRNAAHLFAKARPNLEWSKRALVAFGENIFYTSEEIRSVRGLLLRAANEEAVPELFTKALYQNDPTLWCIFGWCKHSRRIYHVPADLQLMLKATKVADDIQAAPFPFASFSVHLEEAMDVEGELIDTIVAFYESGEDWYRAAFTLLPTSLAEEKPLHPLQRRQIEEAIRQKDLRKIENIVRQTDPRSTRFMHAFEIGTVDGILIKNGTPMLKPSVSDTIEQAERDFVEKGDPSGSYGLVMRLIFGLARYLTMMGQEATAGGWSTGPRQQGPLRVITNEALVCHVQTTQILSEEERRIFRNHAKGGGLEISPHFREGYWSRPSGLGHDPLALKTVWHSPTIVRKDRLPDGALPYGTAKNAIH